jgi:hypothetical protein
MRTDVSNAGKYGTTGPFMLKTSNNKIIEYDDLTARLGEATPEQIGRSISG